MISIPRWLGSSFVSAVVATLVFAPVVAANEAEFDRIAAETASVRGFAPLPEIDESFLTPEELARLIPTMIAEDYPPEEAAAEARSWAALGLVPGGTDLPRLFAVLLSEQVAGFYDPETDQMFVISDADGSGPLGALEEFTYAHEVVHALQDAYLGLGEMEAAGVTLSDDEALALTALYEGDAMVASVEYLALHPGLAARLALSGQADSTQLDRMPPAIAIWLMFPYANGQEFVTVVRASGGWEEINHAYRDVPVSTEQILHPEKYLERDDPTNVSLPDLGVAFGPEWTKIDEDTVGELMTAVMLAELTPGEGINPFTARIDLPRAAWDAAAGWDGDRYALWASGEQEVLVWRTVWDSEADAAEFALALTRYAATRFEADKGGQLEDVTLVSADHAIRIVRSGAEVVYVLAPSSDLADQALPLVLPE